MVSDLAFLMICTAAGVALGILLGLIKIYCCANRLRRREEEEEEEEADRWLPQTATAAAAAASSRQVVAAAAQVAPTVIAIRTLDYVSFRRGSAGGPGDGAAAAAAAAADCCAVCQGEQDAGEVCCALPACGHEFHRECVERWFLTWKNTCPVCRTPVTWPCVLQRQPLADMV